MFWASDTSGRVAIISEDWRQLSQTAASDAPRRAAATSNFFRIHPDDELPLRTALSRKAEHLSYRCRVRRNNAEDYVWVDLQGVPARSAADGSFSGYLGTATAQTATPSTDGLTGNGTPGMSPIMQRYLGHIIALLEQARDAAAAAGDNRLESVVDFALKVSTDRAG